MLSQDSIEIDGLFDLDYLNSNSESTLSTVPVSDDRVSDITPPEVQYNRSKLGDPTLSSANGQSPPIFNCGSAMTNRQPPTHLAICKPDSKLERLANAYLANGPLPTMYTPVIENRPIVQTPTTMASTAIDSINVQPILDDDQPNDGMESVEVCEEEYDVKPEVDGDQRSRSQYTSPSPSPSSIVINSRTTLENIFDRTLDVKRSSGGGPMRRLRRQRDIYTPDSTVDSDDRSVTTPVNTKKRPYRIRPQEERDEKWRDKRDRNNMSVQKSRQKARDAQRKRDEELNAIKAENQRLKTENESLAEQVKFLMDLRK